MHGFYKLLREKISDYQWEGTIEPSNLLYHCGDSHCTSTGSILNLKGTTYVIKSAPIFGAESFSSWFQKAHHFYTILKRQFDNFHKNAKVILSFGEIDCRIDEGILPMLREMMYLTTKLLKSDSTVLRSIG